MLFTLSSCGGGKTDKEAEKEEAKTEETKSDDKLAGCDDFLKKMGERNRLTCAECDFVFYQNPVPAVAAIIPRGEKIVLVKRREQPHRHDWCLPGDPGVPPGITATVHEFAYNDPDQLRDLLLHYRGDVAAIIMTPVGHDFDAQIEPPVEGFLETVRELADEHLAVLIFDEVRTGFRVGIGGAQALYGVTPDLTALGKAMSNGYPVSALVGRSEVMSAAQSTFISSTYFPNGLSMAAAVATLDLLQRERVIDHIERIGSTLAAGLADIVAETGLPVTLSPFPQMPFLYFDRGLEIGQDERRDRFYASLANQGIFAHPRHHGFVSWRHGEQEISALLEAVRTAALTAA